MEKKHIFDIFFRCVNSETFFIFCDDHPFFNDILLNFALENSLKFASLL